MKLKLPEKKQKTENKSTEFKASFKTRSFRVGGYSVVATVIVLAIAVAANVLVSALPSGITQLDITSSGVFSTSEQTEDLVESLEDDITIYWIVQAGNEDSTLETLLERYGALSDKVTIEMRDPDVYPTFAQQYTSTIYNNSLVVECGERYRYIDYYDIYVSEYTDEGDYATSFAGESEITSAIDYVISENLPKIYTLTGHGESSLSSSFTSSVEKENIEIHELSLLTEEAVPDNADCVLIYAPQSDISESEKEQLLDYLEKGGDLILLTDLPQDETFTNLDALMRLYGMTRTEGLVVEGNQNYYVWGAPYYLLADINSHTITDPLIDDGYYVLLPIAQGLNVSDNLRDSLTVSTLLETSSDAYSKIAGYEIETYDKEDGDIDGPFALALLATEDLTAKSDTDETETSTDDEDANTTNVLWISSSVLLDDQVNMQVAGGNEDFFLNAVNYMCEETDSAISIHTKSLGTDYLTMDSSTASALIVLIIAVIPIAYFAIGIYTTVRRRQR